jgi:hypothetical protein
MEFTGRRALEFGALQSEISDNSTKIYQIITSTIGLCAALIGYCFSTAHFPIIWARPFALLTPFLILVPAMILIQANQLSTVRIAGFLMVVYENHEDQELPGWQTAIQWCRDQEHGPCRKTDQKKTEKWKLFKRRMKELFFLAEPLTSDGRHLHAGLRGILYGIAIVSSLGAIVSWWWLICHDHLQRHPHFHAIVTVWVVSFFIAWWLFLLAYRDMKEGWEKIRFVEWEEHWEKWVLSIQCEKTQAAMV